MNWLPTIKKLHSTLVQCLSQFYSSVCMSACVSLCMHVCHTRAMSHEGHVAVVADPVRRMSQWQLIRQETRALMSCQQCFIHAKCPSGSTKVMSILPNSHKWLMPTCMKLTHNMWETDRVLLRSLLWHFRKVSSIAVSPLLSVSHQQGKHCTC